MRTFRLWLTIILPYGLGYFIATLFRSITAILVTALTDNLHLNPMEIGLVTSTFALTFALAQIPLGVLLDDFGPRKIQTFFFLIGGVGSIIFGLASSVTVLAIGRAILGIGMAGGLMAAFKAVAEWVKKESIPHYNGIILSAGGIGALVATTPCKLFEDYFGWRNLSITLGIITFAIALFIYFVSHDKLDPHRKHVTLKSRLIGLKIIYSNRYFWQITPLLAVSLGGFIGMQGLWLGPWLEYVVGLSTFQAANYLLVIAVGMTLGFLSGGLFSSIAKWTNLRLCLVVVFGIFIHILTQILLVLGYYSTHYIIWLVYGYFSQVVLVNYAILAQHFGAKLSGRAITAANVLTFLFAFVLQYFFGIVVNLFHDHPITGYKIAFSSLITLEGLALIWYFLFIRSEPQEIT